MSQAIIEQPQPRPQNEPATDTLQHLQEQSQAFQPATQSTATVSQASQLAAHEGQPQPAQVAGQEQEQEEIQAVGSTVILTLWARIQSIVVQETTFYEADPSLDDKYRNFLTLFDEVCRNPSDRDGVALVKIIGKGYLVLEKVQIPPTDHGESKYYIRFIGVGIIKQVKKVHKILSKNRFRDTYQPLELCYQVESIDGTAFGDNVSLVGGPPTNTICGTQATVGTGNRALIVTIGGVIRVKGLPWAITTIHDNPDGAPDKTGGSGDNNADIATSEHSPWFGEVKRTGKEWSLIHINDPSLALPNMADGQYLCEVAPKPEERSVVVLAGASGQKTMQLSPFPSNMRLPSGDWVDAWKVEFKQDSSLRRGDSGSWVVDPGSGTVYGSIFAMTQHQAYLVPMKDIFAELKADSPSLLLPFDSLANVSKGQFNLGKTTSAFDTAWKATSMVQPKFLTKGDQLGVVAVGFSGGQCKPGVDAAPSALIAYGLLTQLHEDLKYNLHHDDTVHSYKDLLPASDPDYRGMKNPLAVSAVTKKLCDQVYEHAKEGRCVLTLGGDHSIAIGTIAGTAKAIRERLGRELAVIWVDAHTDINTPETSKSGHVHGMPLAFLTGLAKEDREDIFGWLKKENLISLKKLVYIGLRDVDQDEKLILRKHGIKAFSMHDIDKHGIGRVMEMALGHIGNDTPIHLSFDVDALDPMWAPSTGTPVRGGLTLREGDFIAECVHETGCLVAMDLVEVNPTLDPSVDDIGAQQTVRSGCSLVRCALGESLL